MDDEGDRNVEDKTLDAGAEAIGPDCVESEEGLGVASIAICPVDESAARAS